MKKRPYLCGNKTKVSMEDRMKKRAALFMLITLVDENSGSIEVNTDKVKRVFNDEQEIVKAELSSGEIVLAADLDFDTLNDSVLKWKADNPSRFEAILAKQKK